MTGLTRPQRQVLDLVQAEVQAGRPVPTLREIAGRFGLKGHRAAAARLDALKRKGFIESDPGKARSLRITSPLAKLRSRVMDIPVLGAIPAGFPEDGTPEPEGCVTVDVKSIGFTPTKNTFAVRVSGDSMIGRHILDGDFVVLERGPDPRDGQIVAALVDGERTLKTFVVRGRRTFLKAENPRYPNLIPAQELVIQGVFKALIRKVKE